jgi:protein SCO1/2
MRAQTVFVLSLCLAFAGGCSNARDRRSYTLQGQVQSIDAPRKLVVVKHEEIKGFMPAMTMPYEAQEAKLLDGLAPGDLINATLVVVSNGASLTTIKKVGTAPLETPAETPMPSASSGFELLKPGEPVPDGTFLDQDGRKRTFSAFKGSPVVMTFIYTSCPLPTFCPLMDRHFATLQHTLKQDPALKRVRLVTVSFDPITDTPAVLKRHAKTLGADLTRWTFLTGDRDDVDRFASRFGVSISRALDDPLNITHNLRTAVIGADGTLVKVYTGNEWSPDQIIADLTPLVRAN